MLISDCKACGASTISFVSHPFYVQPVHREPFTSDRKIMTTVVSLTPLPSEQQHDVLENVSLSARAAAEAAVETRLPSMGRRGSTGTPQRARVSSGQRNAGERRTSAPIGCRRTSTPKRHRLSDAGNYLSENSHSPEYLLKEYEMFQRALPTDGDRIENNCTKRDDDTVVYRVFVKGAAEKVLQLCSYYICSVPPHKDLQPKGFNCKYTDPDTSLSAVKNCPSIHMDGFHVTDNPSLAVSQHGSRKSDQEHACNFSKPVEDTYVASSYTDTLPDLYARPLDASTVAAIEKQVIDVMAGQALRTICIAYKDIVCKRNDKTWKELSDIKGYKNMELGLTCLGVVGIR